MEDPPRYGVTMLVTPPTPLPVGLTLKEVAYTTEAGQQRYYKAEDVAALVAKLTAPLANAELADLLALEQAATPGPWTHEEAFFVACPRKYYIADTWERQTPKAEMKGNAALIAAMRNALPGLLARVAAAETKLTVIRAMATRSVPQCLNLEAIDRVLAAPTVKGDQANG